MRARRVDAEDGFAGRLRAADYASAFEIARPAGDTRTPEWWARAVFEGAPSGFREFLQAGWVTGLRLRLGPRPSPEYVLGWPIVTSTDTELLLEARSPLITAQNRLHIDDAAVRWTTVVRYERPLGRALWSVAAVLHHHTIPYLLEHAAAATSTEFYRELKHRGVTSLQRRVVNPVTTRLPAQALLETTGRRSGLARRTPIGGRRTGQEFWFVSEYGEKSQYVRNIQADPRVRVRIGGRWHNGTAHLVPQDDPKARLKVLPSFNSAAVRAVGTDLLTMRVDLAD